MHLYHLKLDLYSDFTTQHPQPQQQPQKEQLKRGQLLGQKQHSTDSKHPAQSLLSTAPATPQAARFQALFKPFPQRPQQKQQQEQEQHTLYETQSNSRPVDTLKQPQHPSSSAELASSSSSLNTSEKSTVSRTGHPEDYRFGTIQVDFLDESSSGTSSSTSTSSSNKSRGAKNKKMASAIAAARSSSGRSISTSGAGFQEFEPAQGILRLYRDTNEITTGDLQIQSGGNGQAEELESKSTTATNKHNHTTKTSNEQEGAQVIHPDHGTAVCVLAVPSYMSPGDFLNFVGPVRANVSHFRIIRDAVPNRFMVLMKFRTSESTAEFYRRYNGKMFSSLEPEICHVVYLKSIEIRAGSMPPYAFPFLNDDPFLTTNSNNRSNHPTSPISTSTPGVGASAALIAQPSTDGNDSKNNTDTDQLTHQLSSLSTDHPGLAELPTCPVCLERMDSSVTGLLTILCQHTFHCHCLSKWGEGSCPVCRYSQKSITRAIGAGSALDSASHQADGVTASTDGITEDQNMCALCGTSENLWICLICGHIGCGRYQEKHAYHHYYETSHLYALELETQRVWDYAGDGYVHRLIQNKADGKLVELPSAVDGALPSQHAVQVGQEKLDAIGLEYTYLLTSQLESQRLYFDAQMAAMAAQLAQVNKEAKEWEKEAALLNQKNRELAMATEALEKEKVPMLIKEKKTVEKRLEKLQERLQLLERQYEEEREMNAGLLTNQVSFKERLQAKEAEIEELQEQVRDVMIYLDTQQKIQTSPLKDEIANGTIEVVTTPAPSTASSSSPSGQTRRKGGRK